MGWQKPETREQRTTPHVHVHHRKDPNRVVSNYYDVKVDDKVVFTKTDVLHALTIAYAIRDGILTTDTPDEDE